MLIGARNYLWGGKKWQNPYITDGLVAMWDGVWNIGPGKHSDTTSEWVDLVAGKKATGITAGQVGADYMLSDGVHQRYLPAVGTAVGKNNFAVQAVCTNVVRNANAFAVLAAENDYMSMYWPSTSGSNFLFKTTTSNTRPNVNFSGGLITALLYSNLYGRLTSGTTQGNSVYLGNSAWSGVRLQWSNPWGNNRGTLKLHCVRIYNRAITPEEVAQNYAIDKERFGL
jgi:hypothetical protein